MYVSSCVLCICIGIGLYNSVLLVVLDSLLIEVELHAEGKVGVFNHAVGDEERHGGQSGQPIHFADADEDQSNSRNDQQSIDRHFVGTLL